MQRGILRLPQRGLEDLPQERGAGICLRFVLSPPGEKEKKGEGVNISKVVRRVEETGRRQNPFQRPKRGPEVKNGQTHTKPTPPAGGTPCHRESRPDDVDPQFDILFPVSPSSQQHPINEGDSGGPHRPRQL